MHYQNLNQKNQNQNKKMKSRKVQKWTFFSYTVLGDFNVKEETNSSNISFIISAF